MTDFPDLKIKALVNFPANAAGGTGIDVEKINGNFVIDLDYADFAPPVSGVSDPAHQNILLWNAVTSQYSLTPISLFGGGGGIPDAPNDGVQYGRQSLAWTPVVSGSTVLPATAVPLIESGTGLVGTSAKYAREDHVHPAASSGGGGTAVSVTFTPAGNVAATNVQAAIAEVDSEKVAKAGDTMTGLLTLSADPTAVLHAVTKQYVDNRVVRYDAAQALTAAQQKQGRTNLGVPDDNIVINGDFRVNQIGYVSAAALAVGLYGHDQWKAGASGGDYSFTQLKSSTQITIAAGKSLIQPIEDVNVVGGSYVLSWTGTAQARAGVNTLTPSGAYAASPLLIAGQTAGTVMSVEFNTGTLGSVKLESGALATPPVMRAYDRELLACQRYYEKISSGYRLTATSNSAIGISVPFKVQKRSAPSGNFVSNGPTVSNSTFSFIGGTDVYQMPVVFIGTANTESYNYGFLVTADARL